jgi:hypothetical protein
MSEEVNEFQEVLDLVEDAQKPGKFNLGEFVKGRGYPQDSVEVYVDVESAYELSKLNDKLVKITDPKESEELEAEAKVLSDKILASKLTFNMRGIDQKQVENIEEKSKKKFDDNDSDWIIDYMCELVAANIVSVVDAAGKIDERIFTGEDVEELRSYLSSEAWDKIVGTMQKLTLATGYFKGLSDAGFLQKS